MTRREQINRAILDLRTYALLLNEWYRDTNDKEDALIIGHQKGIIFLGVEMIKLEV